ncbi:Uncharacterized conserved protein, DUF58 family, contains vWF domain [Nocardioides scoriae]|uniref:Uncharacterized conserved protein, DUF58 family, contains vWF domain n=1 Tax=Nocardioides scoriae TaxID=642780 RepID=A0A1H1TBG3_9ACTN|nr:DUF58 domain-containing protein [Nocardioides scoriae]SDS57523.1 Uncharacterized conserved protein, DUF58 family, contains vWF domain [Nocardioides scoriae]
MALTWRVPALLLLGLLPLLLVPRAATAWAWVGLVVLLVGGDLALAPSPRRVEVARRPVGRVRVGEPTTTTLDVVVTGRRRAHGLLRDAWQPSAGAAGNRHRLDLRPGVGSALVTDLLPVRRGDLRADRVTLRLLGPLRLAARQRSLLAGGSLRALPAFPSVRALPSRLARLRELEGLAAVRLRGQGTEFDSLRDYVRGDDVRSVDWRASARTRSVVVRTWQPERDRRVVLVLDTGRTSAGRVGDAPRLDAAMDAALLLATVAARAGDRVSLVAGDAVVRARVDGGAGGRRGRDVVAEAQEAMARLDPELAETDWRRLVGAVGTLTRQRSLVVLLTALEPAALEAGLLPVLGALTARHRVVVASVRDPEVDRVARERGDAASAYAAAAAEQTSSGRARTSRLLARMGVEVLDVDADHLAVRLTDHYLELKARALL